VAEPRHACLLSVSQEQRAEVAARFSYAASDVVFLGPDPEWFLRRLREDGRSPIPARPGQQCGDSLARLVTNNDILCLYDNTTLTGPERAKILKRHDAAVIAPAVFDDGTLRITHHCGGLRLAGELDISNRHALIKAMAGAPTTIDMRSLRFADAGGIEAMHAATTNKIHLRHPQPLPKKVIQLFDPKAERLICESQDTT
jgi:hypothetical protein